MDKLNLNLAVDNIAVYDGNGQPAIGIPSGWPGVRYFDKHYSIFHYTPEEIKQKFKVEFPFAWGDVSEETRAEIERRVWPHHSTAHFPDENINVEYNTVDYFLTKGDNFIYLIHVTDDTLFKGDIWKINDKVIDACKNQTAKVLIYFPAEGYINHPPPLKWLNRFAELNKLSKESFIFTHANLTLDRAIGEMKATGFTPKFTNLPVNYFEYNPWFIKSPNQSYERERLLPYLEKYIRDNRKKKFKKHFSILNRRPHMHRIFLFSEVMTTPALKETSDISLGNHLIYDQQYIHNALEEAITKMPEYEKNYEFVKSWDFSNAVTLDKDLDDNRAGEFTRSFYKDYFCSITVETAVLINQMFFSEKTFKPIFNLQPFIMFGDAFSLEHLRKLGYKTFSNWWDESYDQNEDWLQRLKLVSKVMQDISTWSDDKMYAVTQEMEETLVHNFYTFLYNRRYYEFIKDLTTFSSKPKPIRKLI